MPAHRPAGEIVWPRASFVGLWQTKPRPGSRNRARELVGGCLDAASECETGHGEAGSLRAAGGEAIAAEIHHHPQHANTTAGAERHALALKRGALRTGQRPGYLIWHFTVEDGMAVQHMPTTEQGIHADFDGPGNHLSIGIEMCENRGNSIPATVDRTAKLTAVLMKQYGIPLKNVVPHYHWPRKGKHPPNKNCPHFLMDNGRPGRKWQGFLQRVNSYYRRLQ